MHNNIFTTHYFISFTVQIIELNLKYDRKMKSLKDANRENEHGGYANSSSLIINQRGLPGTMSGLKSVSIQRT
jgi:hypothetical protein